MSLETGWQWLASVFSRAELPAITVVELLLVVAAAVALSIPRKSWRYFGLLTTATHELGHAFAAVLSGQRLSGITLRLDHSGTTTSYSRSRLAAAWSCFWGYPVPAVVGAAYVWCGFHGWGPAALAAGVGVLAASLIFLRNAAAFGITLGAMALSVVLLISVPHAFVGHLSVGLGLALLVGAVRDLVKLCHVHLRRRQQLATSDAYLLFRATKIPSPLWIAAFASVTGASWLVALAPLAAIGAGGA